MLNHAILQSTSVIIYSYETSFQKLFEIYSEVAFHNVTFPIISLELSVFDSVEVLLLSLGLFKLYLLINFTFPESEYYKLSRM